MQKERYHCKKTELAPYYWTQCAAQAQITSALTFCQQWISRFFFTPLSRVLFTFPSRYLFTIGRIKGLRVREWSPFLQTRLILVLLLFNKMYNSSPLRNALSVATSEELYKNRVYHTGLSPSLALDPNKFSQLYFLNDESSIPSGSDSYRSECTTNINPIPRSLTTTNGVSCDFFSKSY